MREIKFRIWLDGYWRYWGFIREEVTRHLVFASLPSSSGESLTMEEMMERSQEYTGLKDKNGKEIYDGDVVSGTVRLAVGYDCNCLDVMEDNPFMSVVTYQNGCPGFDVHPYDCWLSMDLIEAEGIPYEIIGNIYENPELLEAK